jgi:hypothetical protein
MSIFKGCIVLGLLTAVWSTPVDAADRREALMLQGTGCWADRDSIRQTLLELSGVNAVDAESVPDYLLIDVVAGMVASEELMEAVNRLYAGEGTCRAEPMQSCISPGGHDAAEHGTGAQQRMSRALR